MSEFDEEPQVRPEEIKEQPEEPTAAERGRAAWVLMILLIQAYTLPTLFAVPFFNYQYAREHGFVEWLILGELTATFEGLAWPYFAWKEFEASSPPFEASTAPNQTPLVRQKSLPPSILPEALHISKTEKEIEKWNLVMHYAKAAPHAPPLNSASDILSFLKNCRSNSVLLESQAKLLSASNALDISFLNSIFPELGSRFRDEYAGSLKEFDIACQTSSVKALNNFVSLAGEWEDWYGRNSGAIQEAWARALSAP